MPLIWPRRCTSEHWLPVLIVSNDSVGVHLVPLPTWTTVPASAPSAGPARPPAAWFSERKGICIPPVIQALESERAWPVMRKWHFQFRTLRTTQFIFPHLSPVAFSFFSSLPSGMRTLLRHQNLHKGYQKIKQLSPTCSINHQPVNVRLPIVPLRCFASLISLSSPSCDGNAPDGISSSSSDTGSSTRFISVSRDSMKSSFKSTIGGGGGGPGKGSIL